MVVEREAEGCYCRNQAILTDPHPPPPTSAPPRVISKVHLADAAIMVHFSGGL
ncbi:hypothetical protein ACLOJK_021315, partial [Asimina triloba]